MSPLIQTAPDAPPVPGGRIVNSIVNAVARRKVVRIAQEKAEPTGEQGQTASGDAESADGQQVQPSIQTTKTHVALLIPKNWAWAFVCAVAVGGPSLLQYVANRAGLVTQEELKSAITSAIESAQRSNATTIKSAVEEAVKTAVEPIDKRLRAVERKKETP